MVYPLTGGIELTSAHTFHLLSMKTEFCSVIPLCLIQSRCDDGVHPAHFEHTSHVYRQFSGLNRNQREQVDSQDEWEEGNRPEAEPRRQPAA